MLPVYLILACCMAAELYLWYLLDWNWLVFVYGLVIVFRTIMIRVRNDMKDAEGFDCQEETPTRWKD